MNLVIKAFAVVLLIASTAAHAKIQIVDENSAQNYFDSLVNERMQTISHSQERNKGAVEIFNTVDFGTVDVNQTESRMLRFENNSNDPITDIVITLSGDTAYGGATDCEEILPAQDYCLIRIDFRPWHSGYFSGRLRIDSLEFAADVGLRGWGRNN